MIETQPGLVEQDLEHARLVADLHAAAGKDERTAGAGRAGRMRHARLGPRRHSRHCPGHCPRPGPDPRPAPGRASRPVTLIRFHHRSSARMCVEMRSARAAIVRDGLAPMARGRIAPSAT